MIEGNYLTGKKHEIILGKKMAEKLEVGLGDKVIIMAAAFDGKVSSDMFRVTGIFQTASSEFDKFFVFTNIKQAQELLGLGNKITEIAICLNDRSLVDSTKNSVLSSLGEPYEVLSYKDLLPNLIALLDTASSLMLAIYIISGIAMIFGIINTKLMSVFERIREFGILMANGMKNSQIFRMIILEAFFLGSIGIIIGIIISIIIYLPLSKYGIDLSTFAESLSSLGISAIIYPELKVTSLITASVVILLTTILGALYPAIKAIRFEPVKAIRYI
jgi:ABC-type lipoprotein release transport system permease subunit